MNWMEWVRGWACLDHESQVKDLTGKLNSCLGFKKDMLAQIDVLTQRLKETQQENAQLWNENTRLDGDREEAESARGFAEAELAKLKDFVAQMEQSQLTIPVVQDTPDFLDDDLNKCYFPYVQWSGGGSRIPPTSVYMIGAFLLDWLYSEISVEDFKKKTKYEKLMYIWDRELKCRTYVADMGDNWQFPPTTIARKAGDCEDGTVLFVSLAIVAGIKPTEIFNAVGPTGFGYHSYPIVYLGKDEGAPLGEGWYIFESTLGFTPSQPRKLVGSNYWIDSIANWQFAGTVKNESRAAFNGFSR